MTKPPESERCAAMMRIWRAQGEICCVCGDLLDPEQRKGPVDFWTIEHVYPRRRYRHLGGNTLVTHSLCNHGKGDREPNGCEILILQLVNERLGRRLEPAPRLEYRDEIRAPTTMEIAWQQLRERMSA